MFNIIFFVLLTGSDALRHLPDTPANGRFRSSLGSSLSSFGSVHRIPWPIQSFDLREHSWGLTRDGSVNQRVDKVNVLQSHINEGSKNFETVGHCSIVIVSVSGVQSPRIHLHVNQRTSCQSSQRDQASRHEFGQSSWGRPTSDGQEVCVPVSGSLTWGPWRLAFDALGFGALGGGPLTSGGPGAPGSGELT